MICCRECFADPEIRAAIEMTGRKGECPVCRKKDVLQEIWNVLRIVRWMCCDRGSMMKERAR